MHAFVPSLSWKYAGGVVEAVETAYFRIEARKIASLTA